MSRLNKLAVLEAAFNHRRWVVLEGRSGVRHLVLVPYAVSVDLFPNVLILWTAESITATPDDLEQVVIGIGELDALTSVDITVDSYDDRDFEAAYDRFISSGRCSHLRF